MRWRVQTVGCCVYVVIIGLLNVLFPGLANLQFLSMYQFSNVDFKRHWYWVPGSNLPLQTLVLLVDYANVDTFSLSLDKIHTD